MTNPSTVRGASTFTFRWTALLIALLLLTLGLTAVAGVLLWGVIGVVIVLAIYWLWQPGGFSETKR